MANTKYLRCAKCGCDAFPRKWNPATPEIPAEVGTSTMMRCGDCNSDGSPYACMCRDCCPTGHGTRWPELKGDELMGMPVDGNPHTEALKKRGLLDKDGKVPRG